MQNLTQTATRVLPTQTLEGKMFSDNGYTLELATSEATVGNHVPCSSGSWIRLELP
ncbi:hypothetical protein ACETU7_26740 [Rhodococcus sp. 3Y1]